MFNVQKFNFSREIYINYNEYLHEEDDESIPTLQQVLREEGTEGFSGVIDLITVKNLTRDDIKKIKAMYEILIKCNVKSLNVISDNKSILRLIRSIIPEASTKLLRISGKSH
jgi:hypothetical protein